MDNKEQKEYSEAIVPEGKLHEINGSSTMQDNKIQIDSEMQKKISEHIEPEETLNDNNEISKLPENKTKVDNEKQIDSNVDLNTTMPEEKINDINESLKVPENKALIDNKEQKDGSFELSNEEVKIKHSNNESSTLSEIKSQIEKLREDFQEKIKYDMHKNKIIDELHREIQSYKSNLTKTFLKPMVMNIISVIDDIRKLSNYNHNNRDSLNFNKLFKQFDDIPFELEDLLYTYGIESFTCDEDTFNPLRQRVIKTIQISDESLDKKIKDRIRPGYEWEGNMLRPEMVTVYIFKTTDEAQ